MRFRLFLLFILIFSLFECLPPLQAQKVSKGGASRHAADSSRKAQIERQDSVKAARKERADSMHQALAERQDSIKTARKERADSMREARKRVLDSTKKARIQSLDSIKVVRKHILDSTKASRIHILDSSKAARKRINDSVTAVRKAKIAAMKAIQKKRSDSLEVRRKYRMSKRYRDSVYVERHDRMDSLKTLRKHINDSTFAARKKEQERLKAIRKHFTDSVTAVRKRFTDSLKVRRKARTDSLEKIKKAREKAEKARQAAREKKMQLAVDLKIKQKREKWSNQSMLKKKWTIKRQIFQNTFTRYNYYFNANKKMDEALANMQRGRRENYDSLIPLYPFDPNKDSTRMSADMDSIIHKTSVGIQIHDPRTKWGDDLYLLMGEAYYYKGKYEDAATTFRYIISMDEERKKKAMEKKNGYSYRSAPSKEAPSIVQKEKKGMLDFLKHKPVHNQAILWLSRTYTESDHVENAETIMSLLESDVNLPDNLKGRIALEKAFIYLHTDYEKQASEQLTIAVKDNNLPDWLRQRAAYLNGQLLQNDGNYTASATSFKKVLDYNPKIEMEFYARKNIAYNAMYAKGDVPGAISSMKKLLNDGKYIPYYEQIYYVMAQLALNIDSTNDAITYLQKGTKTLKSTKKQKAYSFSLLGNVYYNGGDYILAKRAYDSATHYSGANAKDSVMVLAAKRSKALTNVIGPILTINEQDSLLNLASLSKREQESVVRKYIRHLEKLREDSIFNAQKAGGVVAQADQSEGSLTNWYFSNSGLMQQGYNEFKRKWGNRPLADNWRRLSAMSNNSLASSNTDSTQQEGSGSDLPELDEHGIPTEASLLAAIPNTPEQQEKANKMIQRAYMDLANAYVADLEDYPRAIAALDTLDSRYPKHEFGSQALYLRYLIAMRQNKLAKAQEYSLRLLQLYPKSEYAVLVRPKEEKKHEETEVPVSVYYDSTYQLLTQHQYPEVLQRVSAAQKMYGDPVFASRFRLIEAIALAGSGKGKQADTLLKEFTKIKTDDSLKGWAEDIVKLLAKYPGGFPAVPVTIHSTSHWPYYDDGTHHHYPGLGDTDENGMITMHEGDTVYSHKPVQYMPYDSARNNLPAVITYQYKPDEEQYFMLICPGLDSRLVATRAAIKEFNKGRSLDSMAVMIDLFNSQKSTLLVGKFRNADEAKNYMNAVKEDSTILAAYKPDEVQMVLMSADNYRILLFDHNFGAYLDFYLANYK